MIKLAYSAILLPIVFMMGSLAMPGTAAAKKGRTRRSPNNKAAPALQHPPPPKKAELSSEALLRQKRTYYGSLGLSSSFGGAVGYYLNRNLALEVRGNYYIHGNATVLSLATKYYYGNSFFADFAVGHAGIEAINSFCILVCKSELDEYFSRHPRVTAIHGDYQSFGIEFVLGHRWLWRDGFSFGIDWWSFYVPVWTYSEPKVLIANHATQGEIDAAFDDFARRRIVVVATPLRLQLGWQF